MSRRHVAAVIVASTAWIVPGLSQVHHGHEPRPDVHVPEGAGPIEVPYATDNRHVLIPVSVQGGPPLPLILDTGMPTGGVLLYASPQVDALELPYGEIEARIGGEGGGKPVPARVADGVSLRLGELRITGTRALVVPRPPHFAGTAAGIIGASVFEHFVVEIDPGASRIRLHRPGSYTPSPGFTALPLELKGRMPYVSARIVLRGGREVPVQLVIDTGATHALSLEAGSAEGLTVPEGAIETEVGRGFVGQMRGHVGRIAALRLGEAELRDVVVTFPDRERSRPVMDRRNGNLGDGILWRFHVVFDYAGSRILLKPTERMAEPFEWDMSGLRLDPAGDDGLRVGRVMASSPAADAGLKDGDLITGLDGSPVASRDYSRVVERLRQQGAPAKLEVLRGDGTRRVVTLALRRLV